MIRLLFVASLMMTAVAAHAEDVAPSGPVNLPVNLPQPARPAAPDPTTPITLTLGELSAIVSAAVADAAAAGPTHKVQEQIAAAKK